MAINSGNRPQQNVPANDADSFVWPSTEECQENPHKPGCTNRPEIPIADETAGYVDGFCDCHDFAEPLVHANGTDIAWPGGWKQDDAMRWCAEHKLLPVGG